MAVGSIREHDVQSKTLSRTGTDNCTDRHGDCGAETNESKSLGMRVLASSAGVKWVEQRFRLDPRQFVRLSASVRDQLVIRREREAWHCRSLASLGMTQKRARDDR